jgi:Tol biopolymer transport system component
MALTAGTRLGPYEIVEAIGAGGMGEVYRATDTRLDRPVAIKILPAHWADDAGMKERFDREAQAIASLNHPHICVLHDIGRERPAPDAEPIDFLVMEFLEGETLATRIARGPLTLDEALDVAVPIADALDQAHRRDVVHRDLKPANVMLTEGGPKLLDFGLARTPAAAPPGDDSGSAPTVGPMPTTPLTTPGLLIGTLQYMAPEQLDGLEADARTDIFAFGVVLHEMITGKRAFEGESQVLLISSIATAEPPPLSAVEPTTPPALEHVVKTCLAKKPDDRWQTACDLLAELRWIADGGAAASAIITTAPGTDGRRKRVRYGLAAAAVLAAVLAVPAYSYFGAPTLGQETRYRLWTTPFEDTPHPDGHFAISPDGRNLVFRGDENGVNDPNGLYVGRVGTVTYRRLPGTDEPTQPFWSPDGRHVAFVAGGRLLRVEASGGPPQDITPVSAFYGGTWNADGTILFGTPAGIHRVSAEGGTPEVLTTLGEAETGHYWPHFLPDGRTFLYLGWSGDPDGRAIFAGSLDSSDRTRIMAAESNAGYSAAGHLVFHRQDGLYAQPFDADTVTLSGEPARVADELEFNTANGRGSFEVARDGVLAYRQTDPTGGTFGGFETWLFQPTWVDRSGRELGPVGSYQRYRGLEISPGGTRVAIHRHDETGGDVWVLEPNGTELRLTYEPTYDNSMPIWSPDGRHLVFGSQRDGLWGLYRQLSNGLGSAELLGDSQMSGDIWVLPLESSDGAVSGEPEPFVSTSANETHGQVSPDGRWIAYASNQTQADQYEIYVQPFPLGGGRWQVSRTGGDWPRWSRDGTELYFMDIVPENQASVPGLMHAVAVGVDGDSFVYEPPQAALQFRALNIGHRGGDYPTYAVGPDGTFLVFIRANVNLTPTQAGPDVISADVPGGLTIARNWEAGLTGNR